MTHIYCKHGRSEAVSVDDTHLL